MKLRYFLIIFFVTTLFNYSCTSYKNVPYFQDVRRDSVLTEKINNFTPLTIQPGDLLAIHVTSMNREADQIFNYNLERPSGVNSVTNNTTVGGQAENAVYGYLVDNDGNIHLPMIGSVKVSAMTTMQISADLSSKLSEILTKPVIDIRIENFKISVLGDVKNPGTYTITNEKITVSEGIAQAGDLNTTGLRKNVMLIREIDGKRQYVTLDLTSKQIFNSPFYYLKNNDVIYVQPNHDKVASSDSALARISLILAALSIIAIFLTQRK